MFAEISLPGYLIIDPAKQIRVEEQLAIGGGGSIYIATVVDRVLRQESGGDRVVVKEVPGLDKLSSEENLTIFRQEVAAMA